jgi:hypothetical protein
MKEPSTISLNPDVIDLPQTCRQFAVVQADTHASGSGTPSM